MDEQSRQIRMEPRWPVVIAIFAVIIILQVMSSRIHLVPFWALYAVGVALLIPMAGVRLSNAAERWRRIERVTTLGYSFFSETAVMAVLAYLIFRMLSRTESVSGLQMLTSSVGAWVANVLAFAMAYWQLDRGGPEARANDAGPKPDWLFPQEEVPDEAPAGRWPRFVDYLFLSFSTATAFSPTDTMPLTTRAKLLMMTESAVSLVTLVIVAARAINILND